MTYGPAQNPPRRTRHAWVATDEVMERCETCRIVRRRERHAQGTRWRDHMGEWRTGGIPVCL